MSSVGSETHDDRQVGWTHADGCVGQGRSSVIDSKLYTVEDCLTPPSGDAQAIGLRPGVVSTMLNTLFEIYLEMTSDHVRQRTLRIFAPRCTEEAEYLRIHPLHVATGHRHPIPTTEDEHERICLCGASGSELPKNSLQDLVGRRFFLPELRVQHGRDNVWSQSDCLCAAGCGVTDDKYLRACQTCQHNPLHRFISGRLPLLVVEGLLDYR